MPRSLPRATLAVASLLTLLSGACRVHVDDFSTDPKPDRLFFPAGIGMDPAGKYIYVSNGNADLRYGGGTLMMFDTERFECARLVTLGVEPTSLPELCNPERSVRNAHPLWDDEQGRPLAGCVHDVIDPQVVDCVEPAFSLSNATVRVGNFAGTMRVRRTGGETSLTRRLFMAVRGDPSLTWVDIDLAKLATPTEEQAKLVEFHPERPGLLDCFDDDARLLTREGYDAATNTTSEPPRCDKSHLVQTYQCFRGEPRPGCIEGDNDIPAEPFNVLVEDTSYPAERVDAQGARSIVVANVTRILLGHLSAGSVTVIEQSRDEADRLVDAPIVKDVSPPFFTADASGRRGVFGIAKRDDGSGDPLYYLSSSIAPAISTFRIAASPPPAERPIVVPGVAFTINGPFAAGADGRELLFEPGGQRAFLVQSTPPSLAVLDTRLDQAQGRGLPAHRIVDTVPICQGASHLAMRQALEPGPAGTAPILRTKLYVTCFASNQIMIIDPDRPGIDQTILVGRGPTEIAFNWSGLETPAAERTTAVPGRPRRGFVTLYGESTIGVLDLEPGSPTENRMIGRLGLPSRPN